MRITNASGVRNDLLQEIANSTEVDFSAPSALPIDLSFGFVLTPHALTSRESYTVPPNKIAIVSGIGGTAMRWSVPSGVEFAKLICQITPNGGAPVSVFTIFLSTAGVGVGITNANNARFTLIAGDKIEWITSDGSTGGAVNYNGTACIQEADAP